MLDSTLGLHRSTHSRYIGQTSYHEASLWRSASSLDESRYRNLSPDTYFSTEQDDAKPFYEEEQNELDEIERAVAPHGPLLVDVYFRIVHPSYPILHKGVFIEKYARSYKEFSPPLLAAVYLLAMDWWEYDADLSTKGKPDANVLLRRAIKAFTSVVIRPKLSTVQAGLLLLQRSGGGSWIMTSQVVALAEELGLHQDCSGWSIPDWEKGLRRRLAWGVIMQDLWSATLYGRPCHVSLQNWQAKRVTLIDFPETAADQNDKDGSTEIEKGRRLFIHLSLLTEILSDVQALCTSSSATSLEDVLQAAKPVAMRIREWKMSMPEGLQMDDLTPRKLCSNGYLHLAYCTVEMLVHRHIVRSIQPQSTPDLVKLCREAARARLDHAVHFIANLRPEHLHAFWWFAAAESVVLIGTFAARLWISSLSYEEAGTLKSRLEEFRWDLKIRAKGVMFLTAALQELEGSIPALADAQLQLVEGPPDSRAQTSAQLRKSADQTPQPTPGQFDFDFAAFDEAFTPLFITQDADTLLPMSHADKMHGSG